MDLVRSSYDAILFVSPHFDDAAFSCAGLALSRSDVPKTCITLFGGTRRPSRELSHVAQMILRAMGGRSLEETMQARWEEDVVAARTLGWTAERLEHAEGPFRHVAYGSSPLALFGEVAREDDALVPTLANEIHARSIGRTLVVAPLAVGHHVDHVIAHRAATLLESRGVTLAFYEDFPYADDARALELVRLARRVRLGAPFEEHEIWTALGASRRAAATDLVAEHMREFGVEATSTLVPVETLLERKAEAARAYASQLSETFDGRPIVDVLRAFHSRSYVGAADPCERYWVRA